MRRGLGLVVCAAAIAGFLSAFGPFGGGASGWNGSTLDATWVDRDGNAVLERGPGEPLLSRTALAPRARETKTLARFAQITDLHITDEESPVRLEMLDRHGAPFTSAFRPQEALTGQVLRAVVRSVNAQRPRAVVVTGDVADNDQLNELAEAAGILNGGRVDPSSGARRYEGVQEESNPDPFYYRPDVDPPRHPGMLARAQQPFVSPGLDAAWYPVVGNHDLLVQGNVAPTTQTNEIAVGRRKLMRLSPSAVAAARRERVSRRTVTAMLARGLPGAAMRVTPDPRRRELSAPQALALLRRASGHGGSGRFMDYAFDLGPRVRAIVLDVVARTGGAGGMAHAGQAAWLGAQLRAAGPRWVVVFSHMALTRVRGAKPLLALLDGDRHVVATIAGDVHRNSIVARRTRSGGYWLVTTSALVDYPQQARMFELAETEDGVALRTWMVDPWPTDPLASISRELAFVDSQGGRPRDLAGSRADRNAVLYHN